VRQVGRITFRRHDNALAVDDQVIAIDFHRAAERAVHAVTLEQHGIGLGAGQIVDVDQFQIVIGALKNGARHVAADAAKAVDGNLDGHG
jgi:hypothetical protein